MNARRRIHFPAAAATTAAAILAFSAPLVMAEVPRWIGAPEDRPADHPLWVSIEEAAPNGYMRWELLEPRRQDLYRQNLEQNAVISEVEDATGDSREGCSFWMHPGHSRHSEALSPKELLDEAGVVYGARVLDASAGFLSGSLGTMIEASVEDVFKPPPSGEIPDRILVFYSYAEVRLAQGFLCASELRRTTPKVGGTLILAPREPEPIWPEHGIFWVTDADVFFETESGEFSTPDGYRDHQLEASDLSEDLRSAHVEEDLR